MPDERPELAALRTAIDLGGRLTEMGDELIGRHVAEARAAGASWTEIGHVFGTSKQAAQKRYGATLGDPGRWSPAAREALGRAVEEARALGHGYVGTEHALVVLATGGGIAAEALHALGVSRARVLGTSCMQAGAGQAQPGDRLALMPRFKQALEHGTRIAGALGAARADTEHLLAGIVAVPDSMAVEILRRLGVSVADVRAALADRLGVAPELLGAPRRRRRRLTRLSAT